MNQIAPLNDYTAYPDPSGRFGDYGGRYVPETLMPLVHELEAAFRAAIADPAFRGELDGYLTHYVGRPSPLYFAERLTRSRRRPTNKSRRRSQSRLLAVARGSRQPVQTTDHANPHPHSSSRFVSLSGRAGANPRKFAPRGGAHPGWTRPLERSRLRRARPPP